MSHDAKICKILEDIKGIVAVLDPKVYEQAMKAKETRLTLLANEEQMKKTGIKATVEDFEKLRTLVCQGWSPGQTMIVFSVGEGIRKDQATVDSQKECHRLALAYGLPEIGGYYGIDLDREFVTA